MNPEAEVLDRMLRESDEVRELAADLPEPRTRKGLRIAAGLTQRQAAAALGVSQAAIHRWEHGQRQPAGDLLRAYADLLVRLRAAVAGNGAR